MAQVDVLSCDYLMDMQSTRGITNESLYEKDFVGDVKAWDSVACFPFLDAYRTDVLHRLLWLPGEQWRSKALWNNYCLLKNKKRAGKREG